MLVEKLNRLYLEAHPEYDDEYGILKKQLFDAAKEGSLILERLSKEERQWLRAEGLRVDTHPIEYNDRGQVWTEMGWIVRWDRK